MSRQITYTDITAAWSGPTYAAAYVRRQAPAAAAGFSFMQADFDSSGNLIRTYDYASGRMDLWGVNTSGAAMVVALSAAGADGNNLGHYAYRGKDDAGNYNTFCYILGTAVNVASAGAGLNSKLYLGVMKAQTAGAGNAQPNDGVTLDGSASTFKFSSAYTITTTSGNLSFAAAGGSTVAQATSTKFTTTAGFQNQLEFTASKTSNYTVTTSDAGTLFNNSSAAGEVDFTLPASPTGNMRVGFVVLTAQVVKIIANTSQQLLIGGNLSASAGNATSSQRGASVNLIWSGSQSVWYSPDAPSGTGGSSGAGGWTVT